MNNCVRKCGWLLGNKRWAGNELREKGEGAIKKENIKEKNKDRR